jgi:hypothetical protein
MTTFIDSIYEFYQNPQNLAAFEEWKKERNKRNDDTSIKSERKTS